MKRSGPQKHANAKITAAIMKHEAGTPLSQLARENNVSKSVIKYWIDHAHNYLPAAVQAKRAPAVAKLLKRGELLGWRQFIRLISLGKKTIDAMDGSARIEAAERIKNILMSLAGRTGSSPDGMPEEVLELSERSAKVIVRNWTEKAAVAGQAAGQAKPCPAPAAGAPVVDVEVEKREGNSAT
ncbi:MAG: hypothetical protein PHF00_09500 [Elusimicrobia bacterium]|nr:hypothetical protein [Elusimicrobiota bacterium]